MGAKGGRKTSTKEKQDERKMREFPGPISAGKFDAGAGSLKQKK